MASSQQISPGEYSAESEMDSVTYKWTIKNFSLYMNEKVGFSLKSSIFSYTAKAADNIKWYLEIYPNGSKLKNKNSVSLFLCPEDNAKFKVTVLYRFFILNGRRETAYEHEIRDTFIAPCSGYGCPKFISTETLMERAKELLPNDSLTVYCKITHSSDTFEDSTANKKKRKCALGEDLSDLFAKRLFSDVTLTAQGEEFKAHKIILARSKVFAAMFLSDMKEMTQNVIEIPDMDKEVLRNLLSYLYSEEGPVEKPVKLMSDLLAAADKYDLETLKIFCEKDLSRKLTVENATELLILADVHHASRLKSSAMDFINSVLEEVIKKEVWMTLVKNHSILLNEVLKYHLKCNKEK